MSGSTSSFTGAWLTDIDDTLVRSGDYPDDDFIASLSEFIRQLKMKNIVWCAVSGVALNKMGPRLLFRLAEDVLSHVLYYGGEGGIKSSYCQNKKSWISPEYFQRNFSDEQSIVIVGEKHFRSYLNKQSDRTNKANVLETSENIDKRITLARQSLKKSAYQNIPCLVKQIEAELSSKGFEASNAETYFRGGAISWMMLGDISVEYYKGEKETEARVHINQFINNRLIELNHLKNIGAFGVHMPYLHATRGIKLVMIGNDKGRAAQDLIDYENINPASILFVGNELFDGGNDNPVRRIKDIKILSVGDKYDDGVIDGGVQVEANQYWMDELTSRLNQGKVWSELLQTLPKLASDKAILENIYQEAIFAVRISKWHKTSSECIDKLLLLELYNNYLADFRQTRLHLSAIKKTQYEFVTRLAVLNVYHYDNARKIVMDMLPPEHLKNDKVEINVELQNCLLSEITNLMEMLLIDHLSLNEKLVKDSIKNVNTVVDLKEVVQHLIETSGIDKSKKELKRKHKLIDNWVSNLKVLIEGYYNDVSQWKKYKKRELQLIVSDKNKRWLNETVSRKDVCIYLRWLIPRIDNFPHLKDLDKPTIVLVAGTSGVGKSTISRHLSKTLGIPTSFSSDVASRSVVRETIIFLMGKEGANQLYPELFGSSFDQDTDDWFYAHSLMTMIGVIGNIKRLISENISSVIDGVALIPGTLPEIYFEKANIVWVVASVSKKDLHYQRLGTRSETGVERGGAEHYWEQFSAIRRNHDRLITMARLSNTFIVDNCHSLNEACEKVLERVNNAIADRGLPIEDSHRDSVTKRLHERTTWEVQNHVMPKSNN
jgi:2-phosphoglycerate kinase